MSACRVLPLGLGVARRPILRKGSASKSAGDAAVKGSRRAADLPRCDSTMRSPLAMRRSTPLAFLRNSSIVTVFMVLKFTFNLKFSQSLTQNVMNSARGMEFAGDVVAAEHDAPGRRESYFRPTTTRGSHGAWKPCGPSNTCIATATSSQTASRFSRGKCAMS
jgi:hypothetical protein